MGERIEHDGLGFPEHLRGKRVVVIFRDGQGLDWAKELAEYWLPDEFDEDGYDARDYWTANGGSEDIVAYEVVS